MKQFLRSLISEETINRLHKPEAFLAATLNGFPAQKLRIIGVTGTNGKTSVCHYIAQMLEESGHAVGMITTVAITIKGKRQLNTTKMTTLGSFALHGYLKQMAKSGCTYAVVETTSHALVQNRVYGLYYEVVAMTNVTHEHLDYHKSMKEYQKAKEMLFANHPRVTITNADDPAATAFLRYPAIQKFTYGILDPLRPKDSLPNPDIAASSLKLSAHNSTFKLTTPLGETSLSLPLPGRFTIANCLAALTIGLAVGIPLPLLRETISHLRPVEGRLEPVDEGQPFSIIVDFAHTPDALQQVYSTLRPTVSGRLIAILGAAGNRDKTKRPILGALAARYADFVIVTNEDPGTEPPESIIDEVASGVPRGRPTIQGENRGEGEWWWRIPDRRAAIKKALGMAQKGDLVLVTGKGGEHVMAVASGLIPYNDVKVIKDILKQHSQG